jgi:ABC-type multidrug transport system fused ATPase/permease subunit
MQSVASVLVFGWPYVRRYWFRLVAGLLFGLLFGLCSSSFIWASRIMMERFSPPQPAAVKKVHPSTNPNPLAAAAHQFADRVRRTVDPWLPRIGENLTWRQVLGGLLFLPLLIGVRAISDYLNNYCVSWVSERVIRDLRIGIMRKLNSLSLGFFTRSTTGDLLTRLNVDSMNLLRALKVGGADLIQQSITIMAVFLGLCWLDWKLTLVAMVVLPICFLPLVYLGRKTRWASRAIRLSSISQASQLVDIMQNIRVVKAFNMEPEQMRVFLQTSKKLLRASMKSVQAKELVNPLLQIVSVLGLGAVMVYMFFSGRDQVDLVGFLTGLALFFIPFRKLAAVHILFEQASIGVERIIQLLNEQPTVRDPLHPKPFRSFRSDVRFQNVSFAYNDKPVVRNFSLVVPRGFKLGLAGESGSGKTTIINLLFRFYDPNQGSIHIDGLDLRDISSHDLRQQMALVSQEVVLFDTTVAENIACGKSGATPQEVEAAARAAFAHDFIMNLPQGYDSAVGERGVTLSGGQRQRIAIARAFVRNAPILVLDEATGALDARSEAEVQAAIDRLAEQRTVICIAHRLSTLARTDKVVVMAEGRIIEEGPFERLLQAGGSFAAMAAKQGILPSSPRSPLLPNSAQT